MTREPEPVSAPGLAADATGEGELAQEFLAQIGARVRALRSERSMTVQQLADRSRISRRLLTQIEQGQANPSLVTVTRIARQLDTEFTNILGSPPAQAPVEVHGSGEHVLVWESKRGSTAHLLEATDTRSADLWLWQLAPGDSYRGQPDPARSQELFYVLAGALTLTADEHQVVLPTGASGRLRSDRAYAYSNTGDVAAEFIRTVALTG